MRKSCFLFLAFCLPILFPSSTYAGEAVGVNTLSSNLRNCIRGEINTTDITREHSAVATDGVVFTKATLQ